MKIVDVVYTQGESCEPRRIRLAEAITVIAIKFDILEESINGIRYEDGSGRRFLFELREDVGNWRYIELNMSDIPKVFTSYGKMT